jgi:GntR family transcriptional regulator, transcriptional repressor for pyruvate dehydrogenase complex
MYAYRTTERWPDQLLIPSMPAPSKATDSRRLYQQVADQIRSVIEASRFAPGTRLPSERELALQLGVSRPSLREALIALEIEGIVETRMGSGVYVCAAPSALAALESPMLGESPSELMQARSVLESGVIALAAARVTRQGLDRLRACLEAMRNDIRRGNPPIEADRRFHVTIAELTGNTLMARLVGELFDARHGAITSRMTRRAENARTWQTAFDEHDAILRALELRDPQEAAAAMCSHLKASRERWIEQSSSTPDS